MPSLKGGIGIKPLLQKFLCQTQKIIQKITKNL